MHAIGEFGLIDTTIRFCGTVCLLAVVFLSAVVANADDHLHAELAEGAIDDARHRVIVSTDIGGTDPDDFQSMVHLLVYADVLDIEGLIASPFGKGRTRDILDVIDCYERDYDNLKTYSDKYPTPDALRAITKQGETERAPFAGVREATEGSKWIIECARRNDPRPLHVLVWGGIEDVAQALHDAPEILPKLRVYWIGGPNKKWAPDAYQYVAQNHPKLWIIESNAAYRGWFTGGNQSGEWGNKQFVAKHIKGKGSLGDFFNDAKDDVKMGDTPSVGWLLKGSPGDPTKPGWGGQYVRAWKRPFLQVDGMPGADDRMEVFGILELSLTVEDIPANAKAFLRVENQKLAGHFSNDGAVRFRFCPKAAKKYSFKIESNVGSLDGKTGSIRSYIPSPEVAKTPDANLPNWWTDDLSPAVAEGSHSGAKTVSRWREDYLGDFAKRMQRCHSRLSLRESSQTIPSATENENATDTNHARPRVIVTSDGEIDDECSMVRFLLYTNEWDIEAIVTSSSQYHWQGHKWAGDDWIEPYLDAYAKVHPNLAKHDPNFPTPDYLRERTALGNVKSEGDMDAETAGSQLIVKVLLDETDDRPIWVQAWGGPNTIARALKTIEEQHPEKMATVAKKLRFFFIWEQDDTYQKYIRPSWGKFNIPTIISDQFVAFAYHWETILPKHTHAVLRGDWMSGNILKNHGPLCSLYKAHDDGRFRSEGDSPAFMHTIPTGLRSMESPNWGGWGGRFVRVRENTWLDPVHEAGYEYPEGRWYTGNAWGRSRMRKKIKNDTELATYLKPMWRWFDAVQKRLRCPSRLVRETVRPSQPSTAGEARSQLGHASSCRRSRFAERDEHFGSRRRFLVFSLVALRRSRFSRFETHQLRSHHGRRAFAPGKLRCT